MLTVTRSTKKRGNKVTLPAKQEYCFQPNRITDSIYDYSLIQEKLFNTVIFNLQDAIKVSYKNEDYHQLTIWKNLDTDNKIIIKIPLSDISKPNHYESVKEALKKLASIVVEIPVKNNRLRIAGLLTAEIPEVPDYTSTIDIFIERSVA